MSRKKIVAGAFSVLSAALVATVMFASGTSATETSANSAFAIKGEGLLKIDATPSVNAANGYDQKELAKVEVPGGLGVVHALNVRAGAGEARASVADVKVNLGVGAPALTAKVVEAKCTSDGKAESALVDAKIGDTPLNVSVPPNTGTEIAGVSVFLNKQTKHEDGSVTVTAISVKVHGLLGLEIASAHCGHGAAVTPQPPSCSSTCGGLPAAPEPKPARAHLPVTG